jgi:hypothetical protein
MEMEIKMEMNIILRNERDMIDFCKEKYPLYVCIKTVANMLLYQIKFLNKHKGNGEAIKLTNKKAYALAEQAAYEIVTEEIKEQRKMLARA